MVILIVDTDFNDGDEVADYPIVESYNLPLGKVPSRIEPFTSPLNLAKTHLYKNALITYLPLFSNYSTYLHCGGLIRVWHQRCWTN